MSISKVVGIFLAAGQSRRMGRDKLSLPFAQSSLGCTALSRAVSSHLQHTVVVTKAGDRLKWISPSLLNRPLVEKWSHVPCANAYKGQAHSLICGVEAAQALQADAVMVLLADQPFVTTAQLNVLMRHYEDSIRSGQPLSYVAAGYEGTPLPPVLFSNIVYPQLLGLTGDTGARSLLREEKCGQGRITQFCNPQYFYDIDTVEDYRYAQNIFRTDG